MVKLSRYVVPSPPFRKDGDNFSYRLIFSTRSQKTFLITAELWDQLHRGQFERCSSDVLSQLGKALILVPKESDELAEILDASRAAIVSNRTLYECIQPTGFCNLSCDYCGQDHARSQLSARDQAALVARISHKLSSGSYEELLIGWFGGEPLAAIKVIRSLSKDFQEIAAEHGCAYKARMTTNGLALTPTLGRELVEHHKVVKFEITLDGSAETHDLRRPTARGSPTYDRIYQNLAAFLKLDLAAQISVRCNVDQRNVASVPQLIEAIAALEPRGRIFLYFAPVHDWGNHASERSLSPDLFADLEIEWAASMLQSGLIPALLPDAKPIVCMAVNPHSELIDPHGQIYNCTEVSLIPALGHPNVYAKGSLGKRGSSIHADRLSGFLADVQSDRFDCSSCAMLPVCGGACPKQWNDGNTPCPSAKRNLPERLLLAYATSRLANVSHA